MNRFAGLLAVFEQVKSNTSIGITGKRRALVIEALRIAAAQEATMAIPMAIPAPSALIGVPVVLAFPHTRIRDMIVTAVESPVGDWFRAMDANIELRSFATGYDKTWYSAVELYARNDYQVTVRVENPVNDGKGKVISKTLTMEDYQRALILMATKDDGAYSHHFADFLRSNEDANTADLFMQFAVYGEEVFA